MPKLAGRTVLFAALAVPIAMLTGPLTASADTPVGTEENTISRDVPEWQFQGGVVVGDGSHEEFGAGIPINPRATGRAAR
jgi:hypothetical protein